MSNSHETAGNAIAHENGGIADEELVALLFQAGRSDDIPSEAIVDVLQEAFNSGREIREIVDDQNILSRRQRESIQRIVKRSSSNTNLKRGTVHAGQSGNTAVSPAVPTDVPPDVRRRQKEAADFRSDLEQLLPLGEKRYEAVEEIGRGGWGIVQRARDLQLDRDVAVKKLSPSASSDADVARRFLHEARITAQLQHPGIVPVYERGVGLEDRQPFYAMKLFQGGTLRDRIREYHELAEGRMKRQEFFRLLNSFVDVCNAVGFAHAKNIIHRDLKPANIIVGEFGETIVVDWGLAKDLNESPPEEVNIATLPAGTPLPGAGDSRSGRLNGLLDPAATQNGSVIGTPAFMSPEQARGTLTDFRPATDTYSLGVILYVILTGKLPFHGDDVQTTLQHVISGDYKHPRAIDRRAPSPLASVCVKAMSLAPDDRYRTAAELGEDVARFLANEPVFAHKDRIVDRMGRWCRRNATLAATTIVGAVTLATVSIIAATVVSRAHAAETQAKLEAVNARQLELQAREQAEYSELQALDRLEDARTAADTWLIELSGALERFPGMQPVRIDLIRNAQKHYAELLESTRDDPELAVETARCMLRLGDLYLLTEELEQADCSFSDCARLLSGKGVDRNDEEVIRERLNADSGLLLVAIRQGRDVTEQCEKLEDLIRSITSMNSGARASSESGISMARAQLVVGRAHEYCGQLEQSRAAFETAGQWLSQVPDDPETSRMQHLRETFEQDKARIYAATGEYRKSAESLQQIIDRMTSQLSRNDQRPDLLESRAVARMRWANAQQQLGDDWVAESAYQSAVKDLSDSWQLMFGDHYYSENLAVAKANLGHLALRLGRLDESEEMLRSAVDQLTGLLQFGPGDRGTASRLAACNVALGQVLVLTGNPAAKEHISQSIAIFEYLKNESTLTPADSLALSAAIRNRGRLQLLQGENDAAAASFRTAIDTTTREFGSGPSEHSSHLKRSLRLEISLARLSLVETGNLSKTEAVQERKLVLTELQGASVEETESERTKVGSATSLLLKTLLSKSSTNADLQLAGRILKDQSSGSVGRPQWLQFQAIFELRTGDFNTAERTIKRTISRRRYPANTDFAIAAIIARHNGELQAANDYLARAGLGLEQEPGNLDLVQWIAEFSESEQPAQKDPTEPPQ